MDLSFREVSGGKEMLHLVATESLHNHEMVLHGTAAANIENESQVRKRSKCNAPARRRYKKKSE